MRFLLTLSLLFFSVGAQAQSLIAPDKKLTPGALCSKPDAYRYPEKIRYCNRDVSTDIKRFIMQSYMRRYPNLKINEMNRLEYKIDHYIPLCMGGSNDITNLWPQHERVFHYTDEIELNLCTDLADGIITQAQAIAQIKFAKNNWDKLRISKDPMRFIEENYLKSAAVKPPAPVVTKPTTATPTPAQPASSTPTPAPKIDP